MNKQYQEHRYYYDPRGIPLEDIIVGIILFAGFFIGIFIL